MGSRPQCAAAASPAAIANSPESEGHPEPGHGSGFIPSFKKTALGEVTTKNTKGTKFQQSRKTQAHPFVSFVVRLFPKVGIRGVFSIR